MSDALIRPTTAPADAAQQREDHALGQHLPDQPQARRAERRAHGDLTLPHRRADHDQVDDVDAGDEQHQAHEDQEDRRRRPASESALLASGRASRSGMIRARTVLFVSGNCASSCLASTLTAACACARPSPGFSRPITCSECSSRFVVMFL